MKKVEGRGLKDQRKCEKKKFAGNVSIRLRFSSHSHLQFNIGCTSNPVQRTGSTKAVREIPQRDYCRINFLTRQQIFCKKLPRQ
jgi:hypothetical protein